MVKNFSDMKKNIIIFGDSLVSCLHIKKKYRWIELLKIRYKKKINFKVFAYNGATTDDALKKINLVLKNKVSFLCIIFFGVNDSVYYKSLKGKPRVNIRKFKVNLLKINNKISKKFKSKNIFMTSHKFYRKRLEGNKKTHNFSYKKYRKIILKFCEKKGLGKIDMYKHSKIYSSKTLCNTDGLHLSNFGSKIYFKNISSYLDGEIND